MSLVALRARYGPSFSASPRIRPLLVCLGWLPVVAGCGAAPAEPVLTDAERLAPERLYPLEEGNVWSYNVDTGEAVPTLAISRVVARLGERVEVSSNDQPPQVYELRAQGIYRPALEVWLLRVPIREGETWPSARGMTARVVSTAVQVETEAGAFRGCVQVDESGGEEPRSVRTTYCPEVGPVAIESSMQLEVTEAPVRVSAKLLGYSLSGG